MIRPQNPARPATIQTGPGLFIGLSTHAVLYFTEGPTRLADRFQFPEKGLRCQPKRGGPAAGVKEGGGFLTNILLLTNRAVDAMLYMLKYRSGVCHRGQGTASRVSICGACAQRGLVCLLFEDGQDFREKRGPVLFLLWGTGFRSYSASASRVWGRRKVSAKCENRKREKEFL